MVPATDHAVVVGDGVFESLKVTEAGPFAVQRHLNRLSRSAAALALPAPDHARIQAAIGEVLDGREFRHGRLRIVFTAGLGGQLSFHASYGPPTLIVAAEETELLSASTAIVTVPWTCNEKGALSGVKSTSYAENEEPWLTPLTGGRPRPSSPTKRARLRRHRHQYLPRDRWHDHHSAATLGTPCRHNPRNDLGVVRRGGAGISPWPKSWRPTRP